MAMSMMETRDEIHPDINKAVFFANEKHIGYDPNNGDSIFWGSRQRAVFGKKINPDTGEQEMRKHAVSGVPLVGVREVKEIVTDEFIYKKISDGKGNVYMQDSEHPDVLRARFEREATTREMEEAGKELLRELGASGLTAAQIRAALSGPLPTPARLVAPEPVAASEPGPSPQPRPQEPEPTQAEPEFPVMCAPGKWYLSAEHKVTCLAGEQKAFKGTKAEAEDAALTEMIARDEARANLANLPRV